MIEGNDPGEIKKQEKLEKKFAASNTFAAIAAEFIKKKEIEGAAPVTLDKLKWLVEQKLSPYIGNTPVSQITSAKLLVPLRQIEAERLHETANRAKRVAGQIMRYAVGLGLAERDPSLDLKDALVIAKRILIMGSYSHYKNEEFVKYNDGKLGEAVMLDVLEGTTGKKFTPMQNLSSHGPDGVYIDPVTKTIYLAGAKSSVNGADKAAPPVGSPTERLDKWMTDYQDGKYNNADPATLNKFKELQQIYESSGGTPSVKGVWVQVEVPKFNSSNFTGVETIVSAWN